MQSDLSIYSFLDYIFSVIFKQFVPNLEQVGKIPFWCLGVWRWMPHVPQRHLFSPIDEYQIAIGEGGYDKGCLIDYLAAEADIL